MKTRSFFVCLCLAAFAATHAAAQYEASDLENMRTRATQWFSMINSQGFDTPLERDVNSSVVEALNSGRHVAVLVSSGAANDGKAWYGVTWAGDFFAFELSEQQARQCELPPGDVFVQKGQEINDEHTTHVAQIEGLQIDKADAVHGGKAVRGSVKCRVDGELPADLYLRMAFVRNDVLMIEAQPVTAIPADGVLRFETSAINPVLDKPHVGPIPFFVDLCIVPGGDLDGKARIVSGSLGSLLDMKDPQAAADFAPEASESELPDEAILERIREGAKKFEGR